MDNSIEAKNGNLARLTGCMGGTIPSISPEEALSSGLVIKAVNTRTGFPVYAEFIAIDYSKREFTLEASKETLMVLPLEEHIFFYAPNLAKDITKTLNGCVIAGGELFTVIQETPIPIWMGNAGLIYYADDIQNIINYRKHYNVLW